MSWIGRVHKCAIVFFITIITPSAAEEAPSGNGLKEDEAIVRDLEFFEAMELLEKNEDQDLEWMENASASLGQLEVEDWEQLK